MSVGGAPSALAPGRRLSRTRRALVGSLDWRLSTPRTRSPSGWTRPSRTTRSVNDLAMAIGGPCDDANGNGVPDVADQIIDYISEA